MIHGNVAIGRPLPTAILLLASLVSLAACNSERENFILRAFDREARLAAGTSPSTMEELRLAMAESESAVNATVAANDQLASYWRLLSHRYIEAAMYGEAYDAALKALHFYPDNSGLYNIAGMSAAWLAKVADVDARQVQPSAAGLLAAAERAFLTAIELDDRATRSMYALAVLYSFELDRPEEALVWLERYMTIITENIDALFLYARTLYVLGRPEEAITVYDRIIDLTRVDEKRDQARTNKQQILDELYAD